MRQTTKRALITTTIAKDTKAGLGKIARKRKLKYRGHVSKGRAIDYLVEAYLAGRVSEPRSQYDTTETNN